MSRLTDLIARTKAKDAALGAELEREFKVLSSRRSFGLNFERHTPESMKLPGRPIRKGDKVHILPPRGDTVKGDQRLWKITGFDQVETCFPIHYLSYLLQENQDFAALSQGHLPDIYHINGKSCSWKYPIYLTSG